jgi:hypothetical protein
LIGYKKKTICQSFFSFHHTCTGVPSVRSHSKLRLSAEPRKTRQVKTARCGGVFSSKFIFICGIGESRGGTKKT